MNRLAYLCGTGMIFAMGFYTGQKHSEAGLDEKVAAPTKLSGIHGSGGHGRHTLSPLSSATPSVSTFDAQSGTLPPPPPDLIQDALQAQPSPEDIARQDELNAEAIASMRANHLPEEHIVQMEKTFAAQKKEASAAKNLEPPSQGLSPTELAEDLRANLKQSGVPEEAIEDMVNHMFPSEQDSEATEAEPEPSQNLPPSPG